MWLVRQDAAGAAPVDALKFGQRVRYTNAPALELRHGAHELLKRTASAAKSFQTSLSDTFPFLSHVPLHHQTCVSTTSPVRTSLSAMGAHTHEAVARTHGRDGFSGNDARARVAARALDAFS
eukprot:6172685-Pleurochrysis_carterae.AAC.1